MRRLLPISLFIGIFCSIFYFVFFVATPTFEHVVNDVLIEKMEIATAVETVSTTTMLFVGDVMLARHVERLIEANGIAYPFAHIHTLLHTPDVTIGNFEAAIPEHHVETPERGMVFSVRAPYLSALKLAGFDILSLANNHSYDYGDKGFSNTKKECDRISIACIGTAGKLNDMSSHVYTKNGRSIGLLFVHTLFYTPDNDEIRKLFTALSQKSEFQFVYIHWGDEYALEHNVFQEKLAKTLIDAGADAIIGHHPHVIQDIDIYNGAPIFYSLGNFIFDQYFSEHVMQGLVVSADVGSTTIKFALEVVDSSLVRSQPRVQDTSTRTQIFERIFKNITHETGVSAENGTLHTTYDTPSVNLHVF